MNTIQRIAKNAIVLLVSQIISMSLGFLYVMYTARFLGAKGFGVLSFALSFAGIFAVFMDLGMNTLIKREVARDNSLAGKYVRNVLSIELLLGIIVCIIIALIINLFGYTEITIKVVYIISLSIIFSSFNAIFDSMFQAFEKMEYQSIGQILNSLLMFFGILFAINQNLSISGFAFIYLIVSIINLGYSFFIWIWKFEIPRFEIDLIFWKNIIRKSLPFGITGIFVTIYYYIDTIMLSLMIPNSSEAIGWYNASYRLVLIILFIPSIYFYSVFPVMSRLYKTSDKSLTFIFNRSLKYMMIIAIPLGIGTTLLADNIILLVYGADFAPSGECLKILIWSAVFIFISQPFGQLLNSIDKQVTVTKITMMGAVLNILLNLLAIPKYSYIGASFSTVITEFFVLVVCIIISLQSKYKIQKKFAFDFTWKILLSSLILGWAIEHIINLDIFIIMIISVFLYVLILLTLKGFDIDDIYLLKDAINLGDKL